MQQLWYVRNCSLFERLTENQLSDMERHARIRSYPKGSAVYLPNDETDSAFLLADGRIRICSTTPDGKQAILAFVEPGEIFGELALVQPGEREERAEAAVNSTVVLLPGSQLRDLMEASPHLTLGVSKLIGLRRQRIERRLRSLLFRSNRDRLGSLLLELVEQYGRMTNEGLLVGIKLSHQELANIIGVTRETVTVLLGEMQLEGLLKVGRQKIVIRDLPRLAAMIGAPVPEIPDPGVGVRSRTSEAARPVKPIRGIAEP